MPARFLRALAAGAVLALLAAPALAQKAEPRITGMWLLEPTEYDRDEVMPFTPAGAAANEKRRRLLEDEDQVITATNKKCLPVGMPVFMTNEFSLTILEVPGRVVMLSENSTVPRSISLMRKVHTEGTDFGWNGHSIGRWEVKNGGKDKTLVVDTVGFNDRIGPVFRSGIHSPTTHLVERFHLKDRETLIGVMTFEDPAYLTKPWVSTHTYRRMPADAEPWEYACEPDAEGWSERFKGDPQGKGAAK